MTNIYAEYTPPSSDGGLYHKFEDGKTYTLRIASEPLVFQTEFVSPNGESNLSTKYAWLAWNVEDKHPIILQLPVTAYKKVAAFGADADYGDPQNYNIKITRTGTGLDTEYNVVPSPKQVPLERVEGAEDAKDKLAELDLIELVSKGKGVSNVNWLRDVVSGKAKESTSKREMTEQVNEAFVDSLPEADEVDEPVDLSKIPF